jgi:hypothetical protein
MGVVADGTHADWFAAVQQRLQQEEYYVTWQERTYLDDVSAAYQAPNRAHHLRTYFTAERVVVIPRVWPEEMDLVPWRCEVSLQAWGRGGTRVDGPAPAFDVEQNRIRYERGPITEQYRNDQDGLLQTFTLSKAPGGAHEQALQLDIRLGGSCQATLNEDRTGVTFRSEEDGDVLRYGGLRVIDAVGQPLAARLSLTADVLTLTVDEADAIYPVELTLNITGLSDDYDWVGTGTPQSRFGTSVATAGDTNGDGYSDVIVGAPYYDGGLAEEGRAQVYAGWPTGLTRIPIWSQEGGQAGARFGWSVATAGDVNGDRYADIIVGAPRWEHPPNPKENEGGAWIYHGSEDGPHETADNYDFGNHAGARLGTSVSTAGDVNDDMYADVIVGAPGHADGAGRAYVWHGSPGGVSSSHDWRCQGDEPHTFLGHAVATAGDVNGDGNADIIVGLPHYDRGGNPDANQGAAVVWHGSGSGLNAGEHGNLTNYDWMFERNQNGAYVGISVSTAGDVNGDGYADVIVGASQYNSGQPDEGGAWLFLGSADGLENDWDNFDQGNRAGAWFGFSVAAAGDVNGDGYGDVIVGAPLYTGGASEEGRAWVWHGSAAGISEVRDWTAGGEGEEAYFGTSVATAGDVNGDGLSDVIIGAPGDLSKFGSAYVYHGSTDSLSTTAGWTKTSSKEDALFGASVGTAGDVNGDGYADIIVGAPRYDDGHPLEGGVWVYHGNAGRPDTAPAWFKFSNKAYAEFGLSVGTAGDTDGDGYSEVIVGAPGWNAGQEQEGMAFVYHGSEAGLTSSPGWTKDSDRVDARFGRAVGTAGDVNGDGYADAIVGSPGYGDDGRAFVYLGGPQGLRSAPHWSADSGAADSAYGHAVATAGDVNGDGFSDVIVGAPEWDRRVNNGGGIFLYLGSKTGLPSVWSWARAGDQSGGSLGWSVGTAGDTNGDGLSEIIVGEPGAKLNSAKDGEGVVYVYPGASRGVNPVPIWRKAGGRAGAQLGYSVGTAGDVNGDGYADVIVGARLWSDGVPGEGGEGGAWVYHGWATGPRSTPDWHAEGNQGAAQLGASVGTAGDVNGDGYADVIVGAPGHNGTEINEGRALIYYGNDGAGAPMALRQRQPWEVYYGDSPPVGRLGRVDGRWFLLEFKAVSPFGRGLVRYEIQARPLGQRFDGTSTFFPVEGPIGWVAPSFRSERTRSTPRLRPDTPYHWRIRTIYNPATTPFMPASRWVTIPWNGWNEQDLRTGGNLIHLPLVLRN